MQAGSDQPDPDRAAAAVAALRDRGVIVGRGGRHNNVVKLSPALVIDEGDLQHGLQKVMEVLS
jgi:4-aminobutyrate aminotransferase-like enzyme